MITSGEIREERDAALNALKRLLQEVTATAAGCWDEIRGSVVEARETIKALDMADAVRESEARIESEDDKS